MSDVELWVVGALMVSLALNALFTYRALRRFGFRVRRVFW